ncbi:hypothetical protein ABL78_8330, partial [Leptomonas seymouri]
MAQGLRRAVLAAVMALAALLFTSGAHVSHAIIEGIEMPFEMEMPRIFRAAALSPSVLTSAQQINTRRMLQAFADAMPELRDAWTEPSFCDWSGVSCDRSSVHLSPSTLTVGGTLPDVPADVDGSQVMLDTIMLFNFGTAVRGTLPDSWSRLTHLSSLNLASTSVSGTLPASWAALTRLSFLSLFRTSVAGSLPPQWAGMTSLVTLTAYSTQLSGTLPPEWSAMPAMSSLLLHSCLLSGRLPASWADMPRLERLVLLGNSFCECVPQSWRASRTLRVSIEPRHTAANCATALSCLPTT